MLKYFNIVDISQPVSSVTACFPGDVPFSKKLTATYAESGVINLTAFTMSPHVGTHADAPIHIQGDLGTGEDTAGNLPLSPFVGSAMVIDLSPCVEALSIELVKKQIEDLSQPPERILFKTTQQINYETFAESYACFSPELISYLANLGVILIGIDTPSVDHIRSKSLACHHELVQAQMCWLENLDLTKVSPGEYFLIALPLKLMELEASPVRAVLLST